MFARQEAREKRGGKGERERETVGKGESNLPVASIEQPPINSSLKVMLSLCDLTLATNSRTRLASAVTSGPTPSPAKRTTVRGLADMMWWRDRTERGCRLGGGCRERCSVAKRRVNETCSRRKKEYSPHEMKRVCVCGDVNQKAGKGISEEDGGWGVEKREGGKEKKRREEKQLESLLYQSCATRHLW